MKITPSFVWILVLGLLVIHCKKEQEEIADPPPAVPEPEENLPPKIPLIDILHITYSSATINCTKAVDPENDQLYYSLYLEDSLIISHTDTNIFYKFENLAPQKEYKGKVTVTDSINPAVEVPFNFTTPKYVTRFSHIFTSVEGNLGGGLSIEFTDDGGYIILGTYSTGTHYLFCLKIDSLGFEQWSKFYDIHISDFNGKIISTSNNHYVFVIQQHLVMIDQNGEITWHVTGDEYDRYFWVLENKAHELIIAGTTSHTASLLKYSLDGEPIWTHQYHGVSERFVNSLCTSHDDNYMIFGTRRGDDDNDFWITKIDQSGEMIWEQVYEDPDYAFAEQIILCQDNGFALVGETWGNLDISSARVLKTDVDGNLLWDRAFLWDNFKTYAKSIVQNPDGTFLFAGNNGYSPEESVLVKLDHSGNLLWKRHFKPEDCLDYLWLSSEMRLCPDNGVVVTGIKSWVWYGCTGEVKGLWVYKTDEDGYYEAK